jgi:LysR family transcriptional regulator, glycine cleavage system transcriptional activator
MVPPLKFLRTFAVAARLGSFRAASEELCITPSAVSHQMKELEDQLGVVLFDRTARALTLTERGIQYRDSIEIALTYLEDATERIRRRSGRTPVRVSAPPFFTTEMLGPRLPDLRIAHPDIEVHIATRLAFQEINPAESDIAITVGAGPWPSLEATRLFAQVFVPACSPELLDRLGNEQAAQEVALLVHTHRAHLWEQWAAVHGPVAVRGRRRMGFDSMSAIVDAAERGVGIGLVSLPLAERRFTLGTLARPWDQQLSTGESYFLLSKPPGSSPAVKAVRDWMLEHFLYKSLEMH